MGATSSRENDLDITSHLPDVGLNSIKHFYNKFLKFRFDRQNEEGFGWTVNRKSFETVYRKWRKGCTRLPSMQCRLLQRTLRDNLGFEKGYTYTWKREAL